MNVCSFMYLRSTFSFQTQLSDSSQFNLMVNGLTKIYMVIYSSISQCSVDCSTFLILETRFVHLKFSVESVNIEIVNPVQ